MNSRSQVKKLHERFTVNLFLKAFNFRYHTDFKVVDEPDPPEAIVQSKNATRWVEVTTAYLSEEYAMDLHSYATEGEKHKPVSQDGLINPDEQFAKQFVKVVKDKLEKPTYQPFFNQYAHGYLVVSIKYPLFNLKTLKIIQRIWDETKVMNTGFFKSIYITYPVFHDYKVSLWKSNLR